VKIATVLLLAATGVVWGLAHFAERPVPTLDERYQGRFRIYNLENREGQPNPFPPGQAQLFEFREDGTYLVRILLANNEEMLRREGRVEVDEDRGVFTLRQMSQNMAEDRVDESFQLYWGEDDGGKFLRLTSTEKGYRFWLRQVP